MSPAQRNHLPQGLQAFLSRFYGHLCEGGVLGLHTCVPLPCSSQDGNLVFFPCVCGPAPEHGCSRPQNMPVEGAGQGLLLRGLRAREGSPLPFLARWELAGGCSHGLDG